MKLFTINLQTNMFIYKQFITLFTCLQIIYKICTLWVISEAAKNIYYDIPIDRNESISLWYSDRQEWVFHIKLFLSKLSNYELKSLECIIPRRPHKMSSFLFCT